MSRITVRCRGCGRSRQMPAFVTVDLVGLIAPINCDRCVDAVAPGFAKNIRTQRAKNKHRRRAS